MEKLEEVHKHVIALNPLTRLQKIFNLLRFKPIGKKSLHFSFARSVNGDCSKIKGIVLLELSPFVALAIKLQSAC